MSLIILNVDEVRRTLSASGGAFVVHDKEVDIVRFAINSGFADIVLDGQVALRVMYQRPGETEVRAQTLTYYDTDGLRNYYDWQLLSADLAEKGTLTVALCILRTDGDVEEWHTIPCQIRVLGSIHTDDSDEGDESITPTVAQRVAVLENKHDTVYGYDRQYTDITSDLTFERKAISASGIEDSELSLLAKLPNDGNIECRLNRPAGKFSVWKSSGSGFTQLADWTYYQYRYTGDYSSDYYVAIATPDNSSITLSYYNAISVYKFLDVGISYNANNKLSGKSIAVFGDSIVQGRMVKNGSSVNCTMPKPYSNLISEIAGTEAHNFGIGGALVYNNNWKSLVRNYQFVTGFDVVFICAGTNDFGQSISLEDFRIAYETVVNALIQSNVEVVVCTPTRRSTDGTIGGNTLQNFADIEIDIAETHDLKVINLYALTNTTVFKNQLPDGLHPNEIGAKMIADLILKNY